MAHTELEASSSGSRKSSRMLFAFASVFRTPPLSPYTSRLIYLYIYILHGVHVYLNFQHNFLSRVISMVVDFDGCCVPF